MMNVQPNSTNRTCPFELFYGRPFAGFNDFRQSVANILTEAQLRNRWNIIMRRIFPAVNRLRERVQNVSNRSFIRNNNIHQQQIPNGTRVMIIPRGLDNDPKKRGVFEPYYEGPFEVVRITRGGTYVLRDIGSGEQLSVSFPINKLKPIDTTH